MADTLLCLQLLNKTVTFKYVYIYIYSSSSCIDQFTSNKSYVIAFKSHELTINAILRWHNTQIHSFITKKIYPFTTFTTSGFLRKLFTTL